MKIGDRVTLQQPGLGSIPCAVVGITEGGCLTLEVVDDYHWVFVPNNRFTLSHINPDIEKRYPGVIIAMLAPTVLEEAIKLINTHNRDSEAPLLMIAACTICGAKHARLRRDVGRQVACNKEHCRKELRRRKRVIK